MRGEISIWTVKLVYSHAFWQYCYLFRIEMSACLLA